MINYIEYDISYDFYKEYTDSSIKFKENQMKELTPLKKGLNIIPQYYLIKIIL